MNRFKRVPVFFFSEKDKKYLAKNIIILYKISLISSAPIAQLDRAFDYGSKGCGFDSCWARVLILCYVPIDMLQVGIFLIPCLFLLQLILQVIFMSMLIILKVYFI